MREIKFRAWIPEIGIMLDDITLYGNGQMGIDEDTLIESLPPTYELNHDWEGIIQTVEMDGEPIYTLVLPLLFAEDWVYIEENNFIPMQYAGKQDRKKRDIYEGDICEVSVRAPWDDEIFMNTHGEITFGDPFPHCFCFKDLKTDNTSHLFDFDELTIIGNIYQNENIHV